MARNGVGAIGALAKVCWTFYHEQTLEKPPVVWLLLPGGLMVGQLADRKFLINLSEFDGAEFVAGPLAHRIGDLGTDGSQTPSFIILENPTIFSNGIQVTSEWAVIPMESVQAWGENLTTPSGTIGQLYMQQPDEIPSRNS